MRVIRTTTGDSIRIEDIGSFMRADDGDETVLVGRSGVEIGRVRGKLSAVLAKMQRERPGPQFGRRSRR